MILPNPEGAQSPLRTSLPGDQRQHPRVARRVAVEFLNMGDDPRVPFYQDFVAGETDDASNGGLRVRADYNIHEGAEIGLVVRNDDRFQVFLARVVWKMRDSAGFIYGLSIPRLELTNLP
jgi:hypothetical protein